MKLADEYSILPHEKLPKVADIVDVPTGDLVYLYNLGMRMHEMCLKVQGIGLSAVQIGLPYRFFVISKSPSEVEFLVNCDYEPAGEIVYGYEGCLSLRRPDGGLRTFFVPRHSIVKIQGHRLLAEEQLSLEPLVDVEVGGFYAIVYQHEIDHQKGLTIAERGEERLVRKVDVIK